MSSPGARLEELTEELRTAHTADPGALRARAIEMLCEQAGAPAGLWYTMGQVQGDPRPVRWQLRNLPDWLIRRQLEERIPWPAGDPSRPSRKWSQTFLSSRDLLPTWERDFPASTMYQELYRPAGLWDQLRLVVYDGPRFVAWIGVLRRWDEPLFERAEARRLEPLVQPLSDALIMADAGERAAGPEQGCDLLVQPDGRVQYASPGFWHVLDVPGFREQLRAWVRRLDRGEGAPSPSEAGWHVHWVRMRSAGRSRYLLRLRPVKPVERAPDAPLSPRQREVAKLAAAGAHGGEIASMLGLSRETARTHLRSVYRKLGVTSRGELARVVGSD